MTLRKHKISAKRRFMIIILALIFLLFLVLKADARIRPIIKSVSANKAVLMSQKALNDAVEEELQNENADYDSLVHTEYGMDGNVISLKVNTAKLNLLKARITNNAISKIESYRSEYIQVPIGMLFGSELFAGAGPKLHINLAVSGNAISDVKSTFQKAGINQTHHLISLHFNFSVYAMIPGYNTAVEVDTDITVAETIIVGSVPDNFTEIEDGVTDEQLDMLFNVKD